MLHLLLDKRLCALLATFAIWSPADASPTVKNWKEHGAPARVWLSGVGQGYMMANAALAQRNQPKLYCAPLDLRMSGDVLEDALRQFLARHQSWPDDMDLSATLLEALQLRFPCPEP